MERVFLRSEKAHSESMASIMNGMSSKKAFQVLEKSNLSSPALIQLANHLHGKQGHLRSHADPGNPKGYTGIDGARTLLNDMIYESMSKYDAEKAKCSEYYSMQCAAMEAGRGQISASNYMASNARAILLDSQATISKCEEHMPAAKLQLSQTLLMAKHEISKMHERLALVEKDIEVLTAILKLTDCKSTFMQTESVALLHCQDECTQKSFITFNQSDLQEHLRQLGSSASQQLMQDTFRDLVSEPTFLQTEMRYSPVASVTVPRTVLPGSPCDDPSAPYPSSKRASKCSITGSPKCEAIQERFINIQAGIKDEKYSLLNEIQRIEKTRDDQKSILEQQIQNDGDMLRESQTKLADATTKEANAGENARQTAKENEELNDDLKKTMSTCQANYLNFESEECALRKIRGELYKMKGTKVQVFQDCTVSPWTSEECTQQCGGGQQQLTRSVTTHPDGGAKCLPLSAVKKCNQRSCPVDCKLKAWQGWSKCSAECGGGVQQRMREVKRGARNGGTPCDETSETRACNAQACEKDCDLSNWSPWSACSKVCDGGTHKRQRFVTAQPQGEGQCPNKWSLKRLEYKKCNTMGCLNAVSAACSTYEKDSNMYTCTTAPPCCEGFRAMGISTDTVQCVPTSWPESGYKTKCAQKVMPCKAEVDIVFLIDGSGSLKQAGWDAEIKTAQTFVDAFSVTGAQAQMAVILYSGPSTWGGVRKCFSKGSGKVDLAATCKIKTVMHMEKNMATVKAAIKGLSWPKGSTLTSLALQSAKSELSLGRKDATSVVVVITDGRPLSNRRTRWASRSVRKIARLVWVPVTRFAPLRNIKKWATRRWEENVVPIKTFADLEKVDVASHIVAAVCPK